MKISILASGSKGNSTLIETNTKNILIDVGLPLSNLEKRLEKSMPKIDILIITHTHIDHIKGINSILKKQTPLIYTIESNLEEKIENYKQINYSKKLEEENEGIIKIGRTHLQDATPLYFSQELSGYRSMIEHSKAQIIDSLKYVYELACGATAVGTGINCPEGFDEVVTKIISEKTHLPFVPDPNKFHALTSKDAMVYTSGALKGLASNCMKIANDIRWLASGPRSGIHEIDIPSNEPGSSIMPGKVNPTQCEALTMVAVQVMGNDTAIGIGASQGNFELNVFMPLIAYNMDQSIQLLSDAIHSFTIHCLDGLKANKETMDKNLHNSLMLVTCLNPVIGYEKAGYASQHAFKNNLTLKEAILDLGYLTSEEFDLYVQPEKMIHK